jgi:glycosidase
VSICTGVSRVDDCRCSDPYYLLTLLYGKEQGEKFAQWLRQRLESFHAPQPPPPLDQGDAILITYADQFQRRDEHPLKTLAHFASHYLQGSLSGLHLLPFFPYSSDDGFSVIDFRCVDPRWGAWEDIEQLWPHFRLMFDAVLNHVSVESEWFKGFLEGDPRYQDYFIELSPDTDLSMVVRPRTSPLLTPFETSRGRRWVWTTFSADQVDLNYKNPQVLQEMVDILLLYVEKGVNILRLDAIAYLWKEPGTSCIHLPQTHLIVNFFNALFKMVAPYVLLITETNVPHKQNVSYFGSGHNEAHLVYNFALPPLVLHAFLFEDSRWLTQWASTLSLPSSEVTFFNFLASHDGIGLNPARGILSEEQIESMVARAQAHGGMVSKKTDADGASSPYEINVSYFDALSDPGSDEPLELKVDRFLAAQAVMLALVGLPGIYIHSLFGTPNWLSGVEKTGKKRTINRRKFDYPALAQELGDPHTRQSQVYRGYLRLLRARAASKAFDPHGAQLILDAGRSVFTLLRVSSSAREMAFCIHNLTSSHQLIDLRKLGSALVPGTWRDLVSGKKFNFSIQDTLHLEPYQFFWLVPFSG